MSEAAAKPADPAASSEPPKPEESSDPSSKTHSFVSSGTRFDVDKKYRLIKPIGHGAYGVVV